MHEGVSQFSRRKPVDEAVWSDFASRLHYVSGKFDDAANFAEAQGEARRARREERHARQSHSTTWRSRRACSPPSTTSSRRRASSPIPHDAGKYSRIIVEKPFGHDLASGDALNAELHRVFHERQIFRIDHYLGKETVQNLVALRFGNAIFEPIWNRNHIDHVQITVAEDIGVEGRGKFYEEAGTTRDIVQNHLLQLLMVAAMEPPVAFSADEVRDEKVKVLRALKPIPRREVSQAHGARPVRPGELRRQARPGLPAGAERQPHVERRDVRRR